MTNIFGKPGKGTMKDRLFGIGLEALRQLGWKVERIPGIGKASVRRITKNGTSRKVSIRTSQDTWIAFPRNQANKGWATLSDVDVVLAVSVDDRENPKFAQAHLIEAEEMRKRFDRAYAARKAQGHKLPLGRGIWLPLYYPDSPDPVSHVGGGAGLDHPPIARVPLEDKGSNSYAAAETARSNNNEPLTIAEAKRRLAIALGVEPSSIKITVEG
jgi:hypothetical protein